MTLWYESCVPLGMRSCPLLLVGVVALLLAMPVPGAALPLDEHAALLYVHGVLSLKGDDGKPGSLVMPAGSLPPGVRGQALDSFFADVLRVQSAVLMSCAGCGDRISATPEPTSLLLFGGALAGVGLIVRWRLRRAGVVNRT